MKIKELQRCLSGKLKLENRDCGRHTDYRFNLEGGIVGLPTLVRVSHGSGELTNRNIGHVAQALGLNEHALRETVKCNVGRRCVLACLATMLIAFVHRKLAEQGEPFRPGFDAMIDSVKLILAEPDWNTKVRWSASELKVLEKLSDLLLPLKSNIALQPVIQQLDLKIDLRK